MTYSRVGGGRVYRSDDGGTNWTDCSAGLPPLPINAIEVHSGDARRVWVAADKGVYESLDAGATWTSISTGLPNCIVADLLFHPDARLLRAGTRNRGVWERTIESVDRPDLRRAVARLAVGEPDPAVVHLQLAGDVARVVDRDADQTVRNGAPELWWDVQVERADARYVTYWITVKNLTNQPVDFEGRYAILSYA